MRTHLCSLLAVSAISLLLADPGFAGPGINAEYSAEQVIETEDDATKTLIYSTPTMERDEINQGGQKMIIIKRHDKKLMWTVMLEEKMYMEMAINAKASGKEDKSDLSAYKIEQTPMGQETVNGIVMNKGKMVMTGKDGSKMGGFMWTTKEGIIAKLDALSVEKGKKDRFKLELLNLKIGKQPAHLFEVPKGLEKMEMGGMDMMNGLMGR